MVDNDKKRITILFATNLTGDYKLKPLVINKHLKPHCFKNFKHEEIIDFDVQKNAWMNTRIFNKWVKNFDKKLNFKCCLLLDNFSAHLKTDILNLKNLEIILVPP